MILQLFADDLSLCCVSSVDLKGDILLRSTLHAILFCLLDVYIAIEIGNFRDTPILLLESSSLEELPKVL